MIRIFIIICILAGTTYYQITKEPAVERVVYDLSPEAMARQAAHNEEMRIGIIKWKNSKWELAQKEAARAQDTQERVELSDAQLAAHNARLIRGDLQRIELQMQTDRLQRSVQLQPLQPLR
jgi:hypothetical protein